MTYLTWNNPLNAREDRGKDAQQGKITFPAVYGLDKSQEDGRDGTAPGADALGSFGTGRTGCTNSPTSSFIARHEASLKAALDQLLVARGLVDRAKRLRR